MCSHVSVNSNSVANLNSKEPKNTSQPFMSSTVQIFFFDAIRRFVKKIYDKT